MRFSSNNNSNYWARMAVRLCAWMFVLAGFRSFDFLLFLYFIFCLFFVFLISNQREFIACVSFCYVLASQSDEQGWKNRANDTRGRSEKHCVVYLYIYSQNMTWDRLWYAMNVVVVVVFLLHLLLFLRSQVQRARIFILLSFINNIIYTHTYIYIFFDLRALAHSFSVSVPRLFLFMPSHSVARVYSLV